MMVARSEGDESNPFFLARVRWIASLALAMTVQNQLRALFETTSERRMGIAALRPSYRVFETTEQFSVLHRRLHESSRVGAEFAHDFVVVGLFDGHRLQAIFRQPQQTCIGVRHQHG
jgi:hypothetical protein